MSYSEVENCTEYPIVCMVAQKVRLLFRLVTSLEYQINLLISINLKSVKFACLFIYLLIFW